MDDMASTLASEDQWEEREKRDRREGRAAVSKGRW
jgi:hypothetical protein